MAQFLWVRRNPGAAGDYRPRFTRGISSWDNAGAPVEGPRSGMPWVRFEGGASAAEVNGPLNVWRFLSNPPAARNPVTGSGDSAAYVMVASGANERTPPQYTVAAIVLQVDQVQLYWGDADGVFEADVVALPSDIGDYIRYWPSANNIVQSTAKPELGISRASPPETPETPPELPPEIPPLVLPEVPSQPPVPTSPFARRVVDVLGEPLHAIFSGLASGISQAVAATVQSITAALPEGLRNTIEGIGAAVRGIQSTVGEWLRDVSGSVAQTVGDAVRASITPIRGAIDRLGGLLTNVSQGIQSAVGGIGQTIGNVTSQAWTAVTNITRAVTEPMVATMQRLRTWFDDVVGGLRRSVQSALAAVGAAVRGMGDTIGGVVGRIGQTVTAAIDPIVQRIAEMIAGVRESLGAAFAPILQWLADRGIAIVGALITLLANRAPPGMDGNLAPPISKLAPTAASRRLKWQG